MTARNTRDIRIPFIDYMHNLHGMLIPDLYKAFMNGEFAVQMNNTNPFGRNEADITIENTIKRDCKTTATLILFLDVVFELIEAGISFYIFFLVLLLTVSVHYVCFHP